MLARATGSSSERGYAMNHDLARSLAGALALSVPIGSLGLLGLACASAPGSSAFVAKRAVRTGIVRVLATPEHALPLFTPLGEKAWSPEWDPQMVYPGGGAGPERDQVFTISHPHGGEAVWIVDAFDRDTHRIEYLYVLPQHVACRIAVQCDPDGPGATRARITYTMTGLSDAGNGIVEELTEEAFAKRMAHWEKLIAHRSTPGVAAR